jgi:hypothetical protein
MERVRQGARATGSAERRAQLEQLAETMREFMDLAPRVMLEMGDRRQA